MLYVKCLNLAQWLSNVMGACLKFLQRVGAISAVFSFNIYSKHKIAVITIKKKKGKKFIMVANTST